MKYHCGHSGCDVCGARECAQEPPKLQKFGNFLVCEWCVNLAVRFAYDAAATFGGTIIDPSKPCGLRRKL